MRDLPPGLASHLEGSATTLCHCWKLTRRDGVSFGFTDHDRDLVVSGTTFAARTGLEAAEATAELGFTVSGGDVSGALVSAGIQESDLLRGLYDDASVETWLVNWADPLQRLLLDIASIGEIRRQDGAFVAELRGLMHRFDEERGRLYGATCSADLGDSRCKVDLTNPAYAGEGTVTDSDGALGLVAVGLGGFADGWFTGGRVVWLGGANAGASVEVKAHRLVSGVAGLDLWQRMPDAIATGDTFRVTAGCDKRLATCGARFANVVNFRGFPHMPGNDFIVRIPRQGEAGLDGGSLFR